MTINLFFLSDNTTGGWVTYTKHLCDGLESVGVTPVLLKVRGNGEGKSRPFGYGLRYTNVSVESAVRDTSHTPGLVVALQKNHRPTAERLLAAGCRLVVHDPAEFAHTDLRRHGRRCVTVRRAVHRQVPGSVFVPHPYRRLFPENTESVGPGRAWSVSRIDFDKNTHILLDANRLLPPDARVSIHGFENRIYTRFKLCPRYPEWVQSVSHFPREAGAAAAITGRHLLSCDMSLIKGDGGGTQYTTLEAIDSGSVPVIHQDWVMPDDEMVPYPEDGANCYQAADGCSLARLVAGSTRPVRQALLANGQVLLRNHDAGLVAGLLKTVMGV